MGSHTLSATCPARIRYQHQIPTVDNAARMNRLTVPLGETSRPASASTATIVAISLTRVFVSRALVDFDRSCESFARRQGCFDTCTLAGRGAAMTRKIVGEEPKHGQQQKGGRGEMDRVYYKSSISAEAKPVVAPQELYRASWRGAQAPSRRGLVGQNRDRPG